MEQIKEAEKIRMIKPEEGAQTHLEAHEKLNDVVRQFYGLFNDLIKRYNILAKGQEDADEKNFASFSQLKDAIEDIQGEIKELNNSIKSINDKLERGGRFLTKNYNGIVDTDMETVVELEPITDDELRGRNYLANIIVNEASPNQGAIAYSFPKTSLVRGEYAPRISLKAKDGEHAVLEYDFTIILTEV